MDAAPAPTPGTITCATTGCGNQTTLAKATYIDDCGHICPACAGPSPSWLDGIDPPF